MSKSGAYYNEFDPKAAAWLRELIERGLIADGEVDERSIVDVFPDDVRGFTQCHWFAGLGGWSKALRLAGWPDDRPVWTGSPPCQPFSAAGQQRGSADERHLAPHFAELIASDRPTHVFGEQVASAAVFGKPAKGARGAPAGEPEWAWIDDLFGRLEAAHYACGASDIPAAGVGAPHLRQRTFFVGIRLADASGDGSQRRVCGRADSEWQGVNGSSGRDGAVVGLADADGGISGKWEQRLQPQDGRFGVGSHAQAGGGGAAEHSGRPSPLAGGWDNPDWLFCRDGKWRPVESSLLGLADGLPAGMVRGGDIVSACYPLAQKGKTDTRRAMRLKGYGNAIVPQAAAVFIKSVMEITQ